jgi:HEAT repeat protein
MLEIRPKQASHPAIRDLLNHPAPEVRKKAVSILAAARDKAALPQMEALLQDVSLDVRTEALCTLAHCAHVDPLSEFKSWATSPISPSARRWLHFARPGKRRIWKLPVIC